MTTTGTIDVAAVRARHRIEDVVAASGVELRPTGKSLMGCCPLHEDHTASLSVGGIPDRFHCFGCGASGDVIEYVARLRNLTFRDAVAYLENDHDLGMPSAPRAPAPRLPQPPTIDVAAGAGVGDQRAGVAAMDPAGQPRVRPRLATQPPRTRRRPGRGSTRVPRSSGTRAPSGPRRPATSAGMA